MQAGTVVGTKKSHGPNLCTLGWRCFRLVHFLRLSVSLADQQHLPLDESDMLPQGTRRIADDAVCSSTHGECR